MVRVLIGIVILAVVVYLGIFVFQRRTKAQVKRLQAKQAELAGIPLAEALALANQLSLTGQSLEQYQQLQTRYEDITTNKFPRIETQLATLTADANGINFVKTNQDARKVSELVAQTDDAIHEVQAGVAELQEVDKQHRQAVRDLEKTYQGLRKKLLAENFSFGPSIDGLEDQLSDLEQNFDDFTKLTAAGDHQRAAAILTDLTTDTQQLQTLIETIPPVYQRVATEFPAQIEDLKSGHEKLVADHYHFGAHDIEAEIAAVNAKINDNLATLTALRVEDASLVNDQIAEEIDGLYDIMQTEIDAKKPVMTAIDGLASLINHAQNQNHALLTELDRLRQNYTLDHQEVETARELNEQLKTIDTTYQQDVQALADQSATYSEILAHQQQAQKDLNQIEQQQTDIAAGVAGLANEEKQARETLQRMDFRLHGLRRQVENLNLPGIPQDYLDYFSVVRSEVEKLATAMDQPQIDMEDITKQLIMIQADLDTLKERTQDLIDSATLSEQLLQYANRYKASHDDVAAASARAQDLFDHQYNYAKALETIATVLDQVEPGAYKRLENAYYDQKQGHQTSDLTEEDH